MVEMVKIDVLEDRATSWEKPGSLDDCVEPSPTAHCTGLGYG